MSEEKTSSAAAKDTKDTKDAKDTNVSVSGGAVKGNVSPSAGKAVRLTVNFVDPFSVLKLSFLLSIAFAVAMVVAVVVLWSVLAGMGVFENFNNALNSADAGTSFNVGGAAGLGKTMAVTVVIGVINVLIWTAMSTVAAYLYNFGAAMVGGLHVTLTNEQH